MARLFFPELSFLHFMHLISLTIWYLLSLGPITWRRRDYDFIVLLKPIIFCDMRTSGLFDSEHYRIIDDRGTVERRTKRHESIEVDPEYLTISLKEKLEQFGPNSPWKRVLSQKRIIKTPEEIQNSESHSRKIKCLLVSLLPSLQVGVTERGGSQNTNYSVGAGCSGSSFPPIVALESIPPCHIIIVRQRALKPGEHTSRYVTYLWWLLFQIWHEWFIRKIYQKKRDIMG